MTTLEYHLAELEVATAASDPRKILPELPPQFSRILDLGCGAGQTLVACNLPPDVATYGVDIDAAPLAVGKTLNERFNLLCATGEQLPFRAGVFDVVISRVALPYMNIPVALGEIARILKSGGGVWFTLHSLRLGRQWWLAALRAGRWKHLIYLSYAWLNSGWLHLFGKQFRYPLNQRRCESFQTVRGITRALLAAGFAQVQTEISGQFFVVKAVKK